MLSPGEELYHQFLEQPPPETADNKLFAAYWAGHNCRPKRRSQKGKSTLEAWAYKAGEESRKKPKIKIPLGSPLLKKRHLHKVIWVDFPAHEILTLTGLDLPSREFHFGTEIVNVHMNSLRYAVFNESTICCECGVVGTIMRLEATKVNYLVNPSRAHFNLYAETPDGLLLMTKDHILPKCFGGPDTLRNMRTMCAICNHARGHEPPS
jgi:hypothetical protein